MHTRGRPNRRLLSAVTVTATAGLAFGMSTPLTASAAGPHVVDGRGAAYNDWGDEGTLSVRRHAESNATRLWQTILYADGAKWRDGNGRRHTFTKYDIDGSFGWKTRAATKWWQESQDDDELENVDGIVDGETFGLADDALDGPYRNGNVTYSGYRYDVTFKRLDGKYYVKIDRRWRVAAYNWSG
ncbi:peptidoglycan-binding domain-containing protein [Streptomyces sp. NPDC050704]|uniref:peptidoglycan-binding domain-containing protein n=1 Tax=Streptomyces sp. NPDC050704 TaxID=3157219 RepID=UPI00343E2BD3